MAVILTVEAFEKFLADFRRKRAGITPAKTVRTSCKSIFALRDSTITEWSSVSVEIITEIVEVENKQISFYLKSNGFGTLLVTNKH